MLRTVEHIHDIVGLFTTPGGSQLLVLVFGVGNCYFALPAAWYVILQQQHIRNACRATLPLHARLLMHARLRMPYCSKQGWLDPRQCAAGCKVEHVESIRTQSIRFGGTSASRKQKARGMPRLLCMFVIVQLAHE
jgi:hypothetical protein